MRVHVHGEQGVHLHVRLVYVIPVGERRVLHPPVRRPAVVRDDVHDHFQAFLMGSIHHLPVQGIVTEAGVDVIVIGTGIPVVGLLRLVIQQQRRAPKGRRPEVRYIIQMVDDALDVAAMPRHRVVPVHDVRRLGNIPGKRGAIVIGLSVPPGIIFGTGRCEPVRHDQVDEVLGREALPVGAPLLPSADQVGVLDHLLPVTYEQVVCPGLGIGIHLHVHEQEIRVRSLMQMLDTHAFSTRNGNLLPADVLPLHHQLERSLHPGPPGQRLHAGHFLPGRIRHEGRVRSRRLTPGQSGCHGRRRKRFLQSIQNQLIPETALCKNAESTFDKQF